MDNQTSHTPNLTPSNEGAGIVARIGNRIRHPFSGGKAQNTAQMVDDTAAQLPEKTTVKRGVVSSSVRGADRAVGAAHGRLSRVNNAVFYTAGMAATMLGFFGKIPFLGKPFEWAAGMVTKPQDVMENTTVSEAGRSGSKLLGKLADASASRDGEAGPSQRTEKLAGWAKTAAEHENSLLSGAKQRAVDVANPMGDFVEQHAGSRLKAIGERIGKGAAESYTETGEGLTQALQVAEGNKELAGVGALLKKAQSALGGSASEMDRDAIGSALSDAGEALGDLKGKVDDETLQNLTEKLGGASTAFGAADHTLSRADKFANLPDKIRNAPDTLAKSDMKTVALKGAVITGTTLQVTSTARGIGDRVHTLKQVYMDMTGEDKISTRKLMFSKNVPDVIKRARSNIMKEFGPRTLLNFANMVATYAFSSNNSKKGMVTSMALMGVTQLHTAKAQTYGMLAAYEALDQQPEITPEGYATFISQASKEAQQAGGEASPVVQELAIQYADSGARPADILKEIENGQFDQRAQQVMEARKQAGEKAIEKAEANKMRPGVSDRAEREVMGAHTQRLQNEAMQQRQGPDGPPASGR